MTKRKRRVRKDSPIAENQIHTWVGEAQFNRGLKYIDQGLVHRTHRRGYVVSAIIEGKRHGPQLYRVRATVAEGKIEDALCTCSIGKHGICPHIAAMLVCYSRSPDEFTVVSVWGWMMQLLGLKAGSR
jgi:uncharacterized Zn finger protein